MDETKEQDPEPIAILVYDEQICECCKQLFGKLPIEEELAIARAELNRQASLIIEQQNINASLRRGVIVLEKRAHDAEIQLKNVRQQLDVTKLELTSVLAQLRGLRNKCVSKDEQILSLKKENFIAEQNFSLKEAVILASAQVFQTRLEEYLEEEAERRFEDQD